jgi:hypothetical protein
VQDRVAHRFAKKKNETEKTWKSQKFHKKAGFSNGYLRVTATADCSACANIDQLCVNPKISPCDGCTNRRCLPIIWLRATVDSGLSKG